MLLVQDHIVNQQTLNFWNRYFSQEDLNVKVNTFIDALFQEYTYGLIKPQVTKLLQQNDTFDTFNFEELLSDLRQDLTLKLSIDSHKISLNALNLFTRDLGLDRALIDLVTDSLFKQKAKKSL